MHVKVCCIQDAGEAALAVRLGASAVGLVSAMPTGPGPISDERIAQIAPTVPPGVSRFLLTCRTDANAVVEQVRRCGCEVVQLCDALKSGTFDDLRRACPGLRVVQVIHVQDEASLEEAREAEHAGADALLLDSGRTRGLGSASLELGGTGRVHDWGLSRRIVDGATIPVWLAGGLRADNVAEAIRAVRPFGVDLCNGMRTAGVLDETKLRAFVAATR